MRWLRETVNGKIWEMQSHATAGTLIKNWVNCGGNAGDVVEVTGTEAEYQQALKDAVSLVDYKKNVGRNLWDAGKAHMESVWTVQDQLNVASGVESGNTTKVRRNTFKRKMKTEWLRLKAAVIAAADKAAVDAVTPKWPTTPAPNPSNLP